MKISNFIITRGYGDGVTYIYRVDELKPKTVKCFQWRESYAKQDSLFSTHASLIPISKVLASTDTMDEAIALCALAKSAFEAKAQAVSDAYAQMKRLYAEQTAAWNGVLQAGLAKASADD